VKLSRFQMETIVFAISVLMVGTSTTAAVAQEIAVVVAEQKVIQQAKEAEELRIKMQREAEELAEKKKDAYARERQPLSPLELKELLMIAGFEGKALKSAWAIVMKESGGRPKAHNGNSNTGDNSYGLFQINMIGGLGEDRRNKFDLKQNTELFNPLLNAEIAHHMSGGGDDFGAWGLGPNAYNGGKVGSYYEWLAKYPED
jgi:hypothetical protein